VATGIGSYQVELVCAVKSDGGGGTLDYVATTARSGTASSQTMLNAAQSMMLSRIEIEIVL